MEKITSYHPVTLSQGHLIPRNTLIASLQTALLSLLIAPLAMAKPPC